MSVPNQSVRPTPTNLDPPDTVCLQIEVPNDREWIASFLDAVEQLSYWFSWDRDEAKTGRSIAERWWRAFLTIRKCHPEQPMDGCCDGSEETLIRQNPDNPCLLESSSDGIHWCTLFDQSLCTPANGQPGSGSRQPLPGGGEECYHADFPATMQWNLPTVVNAGDVIEVKNTQGQATDAPNHVWYCPNGQLFFAGGCTSVPFLQGGDPAATANHMTIVCEIAGVWYPTDTPLTVPGGVSNAPVVFQVNDGVLSDNSGGYSYDVCVTNNQAEEWSSVMDFRLSSYDFLNVPADDGGEWIGGTGWQGTDKHLEMANCYKGIAIKKTFTAANITKIVAESDVTMGTGGGCCGLELARYTPGRVSLASLANANGHQVLTWTGPLSMTNFEINQAVGVTSDNCVTSPGGSVVFPKVTVYGTGTKPPEFP